jgi:chromosomal replication initiator protein
MDQVWPAVLERLEERVGKQNFETWIKPLAARHRNQHEVLVETPSRFFRDWVAEHFLTDIETALATVAGEKLRVKLAINSQLPVPPTAPAMDAKRQRTHWANSLVPKYTFENFVVGASNQFAHAASLAVANQPGDHYNPLFIYGGVGLGKTHLVNAIGHQIITRRPGLRVLYLSSESFMNELIASLRRDKMDEFKMRFRTVDVLLLDDVQFIAGKERTQEEFFHTFNSLYDSHKQIVITSDRFPKEIPDLEDRLRNRFEWGLIADIQPPDIETRLAILGKKAEAEGVSLPHEVAIFLASNIHSNVRELEGSLTRLTAFSSLTKTPITIDLVKEVLRNTLSANQKDVTVESIQKVICDFYNLKMAELKAKRRTKNIAFPRQIAMYLCRKYTGSSFPAIGDKFGGRDHSTVIHASRVIEQRVKNDPQMRAIVEKIERTLNIKN